MAYSDLTRASLDINYLHANSTSHAFAFGAMAELVDNARDAGATELRIGYEKCPESFSDNGVGCMLTFLDNGCGMSVDEATDVMVFGRSSKTISEHDLIGMFGNGLKSGSMRLSKDMAFFTKKDNVLTCVLLSRTFFEKESINQIIIPVPSFSAVTKKPTTSDKKFEEEMSIFTKYSPFDSEEAIFEQFDRIEGPSGTLVVCFRPKILPSGESELTYDESNEDILLGVVEGEESDGIIEERASFRAYSAVLYSQPKMKIYINNQKVITRRPADSLYNPAVVSHATGAFKKQSERASKLAEEESLAALDVWNEAQGKTKRFYGQAASSSRSSQTALRILMLEEGQKKKNYEIKSALAAKKKRDIRNFKTIQFVFGIHLNARGKDGFFVYNNGRLVKMYEVEGTDLEKSSSMYRGVIGVVDVSYAVLEPTHNKQDFSTPREYKNLKKMMNDSMRMYWDEQVAKTALRSKRLSDWWQDFGYETEVARVPSDDLVCRMKRLRGVSKVVQCDECLKWRILPFSKELISSTLPDDWVCNMNKDFLHKTCKANEEQMKMPEISFVKKGKTADEKMAENQEKLKALEQKNKKFQKEKEMEYVPPSQMGDGPARSSRGRTTDLTTKPTQKPSSRPAPKREPSPEPLTLDSESSEEEEEAVDRRSSARGKGKVGPKRAISKEPPKPAPSKPAPSKPAPSKLAPAAPARKSLSKKKVESESEEEESEVEEVVEVPVKVKAPIKRKIEPAAPSATKKKKLKPHTPLLANGRSKGKRRVSSEEEESESEKEADEANLDDVSHAVLSSKYMSMVKYLHRTSGVEDTGTFSKEQHANVDRLIDQHKAASQQSQQAAVSRELQKVKTSLATLLNMLEISLEVTNDSPEDLHQRIEVLITELQSFREEQDAGDAPDAP